MLYSVLVLDARNKRHSHILETYFCGVYTYNSLRPVLSKCLKISVLSKVSFEGLVVAVLLLPPLVSVTAAAAAVVVVAVAAASFSDVPVTL